MSLSSRDIEDINKEDVKLPFYTGAFLFIFKLINKLPGVSNYLSNTTGGLSGTIFRYWNNNDYQSASDTVIFALEKYRNKKSLFFPFMNHHNWWQFMKHGVEIAHLDNNSKTKEILISYANTGIEPFEGHYVAYSFLGFSRWKYTEQDYDNAIKYASIAAKADSTWAEPEFLLGWYALVLGNHEAEKHLTKAIDKDHRILFRVANDDICKQHPTIINKLKEKYSSLSNESQP